MKHFLRTALLAFVLVALFSATGNAQACSVRNLTVKINSITSTATSCVVNADISWIQAANGGNKFTNVHLWSSANYPTTAIAYTKPPTATELANAIGTIVIKDPSSATPTLYATYPPNSSVTMVGTTASTQLTKTANVPSSGLDSFHISNVNLTLSGTNSCATTIILKSDIWSTQSKSDQTIQCSSVNGTFTISDPVISGVVTCTTPRKYQVLVNTISQTALNFDYSVYADTDNSGGYSATDVLVGSGSGSAVAGSRYNSGLISYTGYAASNLSVVVFVSGVPIAATGLITNGCSLPVKYKSFEATRESSSLVNLKWSTSMEQNNSGFEVQRKDGNGTFRTIQFVNSKAEGGQSSIDLSYSIKDQNIFEGMTQYRIAQVDFDGHKAYSTIAVVNGKPGAATTVLVYPNPAVNGSTNMVFNNTDAKQIFIADMSGRVVRTFSNYTANSIQLSGLSSGVYVAKIINEKKNEVITEKITAK